ncbi:MAG: hypothetical protein ACI8PZ_007365 [Myxococcota bacterium]
MSRVRVIVRPSVPQAATAWDAAQALARLLAQTAGCPQVVVTVNTNRRRLLSWQGSPSTGLAVLVHYKLLTTPDDVVAAVVRQDAEAIHRIRAVPTGGTPPSLAARGDTHDLTQIRRPEDERVRWLAPRFASNAVPVGWGRWPSRPPRHTIRLGSMGGTPPIVRIHPVLDDARVPDWFVGFVVFHELLHGAFPPRAGRSRRTVHTPEFRTAERTHARYADSLLWEEANVATLIQRIRRRDR